MHPMVQHLIHTLDLQKVAKKEAVVSRRAGARAGGSRRARAEAGGINL